MSHPAEQSAFLRWTAFNPTAVRNTLVEVRHAGGMGFGVFAIRDISRGTRIIEEAAMMVLPDTRGIYGELEAFCDAFKQLTEAKRCIFDQLHCDPLAKHSELQSAVRRWRKLHLTHDTDGRWLEGRRCREVSRIIDDRFTIWRSNFVHIKVGDAPGEGLFALTSRINHSCVPNAHAVFNAAIERLTVHAIRHITRGEQITISYLDDPIVSKQVRTSMLAPWNFSCSCAACTDPAMEARNGRIQELKRLLASYDATNKALEKFLIPSSPVKEALPAAMELVALLEEQGITGLELASAYQYCAIHSFRIGSYHAAKNYTALEHLTRWYACGRDVLQGDGNDDTEDALSQVEQGFVLWDQQLKEEPWSPYVIEQGK